MNKKALTALRGSIEKWEKIVAGKGADFRGENCPLCMAFEDCDGCPVAQHTGVGDCHETPYDAWAYQVPYGCGVRDFPTEKRPYIRALAQAELDFLKSLLPEEA